MTATRLADTAAAYLARLDAALAGVDPTTRAEILAGVREELEGVPEEAAAERIRMIGEPAFVAAEARGALPGAPGDGLPGAPTSASTPTASTGEPAWFAVVAGLLVMIGGVVVPVVGALAGYVMVWLSRAWSRRQKLIATAIPLAYAAVLCAVVAVVANAERPARGEGAGGAVNPLLPAEYDVMWSGILLFGVLQLGVGIWLLALARRSRIR